MGFELKTLNGYDMFEVASALQKEIRRGNKQMAVFWGLELWRSNEHFKGYEEYLWRRLLVISAEDILHPFAPIVVKGLYDLYKTVDADKKKHRIFITRAIVDLCNYPKNRNADHMQILTDKMLENGEKPEIPEYALDKHTRRGKMAGKSTIDFLKAEYEALQPLMEDEEDKQSYNKLLTLFD